MRTVVSIHEHVGDFRRTCNILKRRRWEASQFNGADMRARRVRELSVPLAARHDEMLATGDLLIRALAIITDLTRRLSKQPADRVLLLEQKHYEKLVRQLLWEHQTALAQYLASIRCLSKR